MFVLDTAGVDGRDCLRDLKILLQELEACVCMPIVCSKILTWKCFCRYKPGASAKPCIVVANKSDVAAARSKFEHLSAALRDGRFGFKAKCAYCVLLHS
jgi:GTPase involved in cell partitioning and DNA repair